MWLSRCFPVTSLSLRHPLSYTRSLHPSSTEYRSVPVSVRMGEASSSFPFFCVVSSLSFPFFFLTLDSTCPPVKVLGLQRMFAVPRMRQIAQQPLPSLARPALPGDANSCHPRHADIVVWQGTGHQTVRVGAKTLLTLVAFTGHGRILHRTLVAQKNRIDSIPRPGPVVEATFLVLFSYLIFLFFCSASLVRPLIRPTRDERQLHRPQPSAPNRFSTHTPPAASV